MLRFNFLICGKFVSGLKESVIIRSQHGLTAPSYKIVGKQYEAVFENEKPRTKEIGYSEFWRRKMRTVHNLLDVNKDGIISFDDFQLLADRFVYLGHLPCARQVEFYDIIKQMWQEQWGCIDPYNLVTVQQYLEYMKYVVNDKDRRKRVHRLLPYIFQAVDKNKDGNITFAEYLLFFRCLGLTHKDAVSSFQMIDTDNDGTLSIHDFVTQGREYFLTDDEESPSKLFWGPLAQ